MSIAADTNNLESAVRSALLTTRATAVCPFHPDVTIRVGDDAAETHAFIVLEISSGATAPAGSMSC